jgi:hypothetical protein
MHMTFEKIAETPLPSPEHPAYRAAKMIKELHEENIAKIDGGFVFLKDGVDCSAEMREECVKQIAMCQQIMERSKDMDPKHWEPAALICAELESTIGEQRATSEVDASIPEIGNYDHGK